MADEGQLLSYFHTYVASIRRHLPYICCYVQSFHVDMLVNVLAAEDTITQESFEELAKSPDGEKAKVLFDQLLMLQSPIWCQTVLQMMRQMGLDEVVDVIEGIKIQPAMAIPEIAESSKSSHQNVKELHNVSDVTTAMKPLPLATMSLFAEPARTDSFKKFEAEFFETLDSDSSGSYNVCEDSDLNALDDESSGGNESRGGNELKLRRYQLELAEPALTGENCVIVAPTGCGKTFVALHIALEHLVRRKGRKVVFLVHKVPLVQQQFDLFKRFISPKGFDVEQLSSANSTSTPAVKLIKSIQVLVMTHQILLTTLKEESPELLHEISLLIFDECHHTMKNHPYNDIMRIYLKKKAEGTQQNFPQIVGLTASPGSGKSNSVEQGCKHIFKLLANLDAKIPPVQVKENREELSAFTTNEDFETVSVDRNHRDQFTTRIQHIMQRIEKQIKDKIEQNENVLENFYFNVPDRRGQPVYENEVIAFREKSKLLEEHELSHHFQIYANHLKVYNDALLINEHVRESDAIKYIEENLFQTFHDVEMKLRELYDKSEISKLAQNTPSPLLQKLIESIHQNFSSNPNSRCIIFARTRDIATSLVTCLADSQPLMEFNLNPDYLTGSGAKNSQGGLTKPLQDDKLKRFRDGKSKVMIATSIADEGIDIKECNLVITYNHCSSEIAQVQRKGRGRAKQSKMFILAYSDHHYIERERLNRDRNELTRQTLEYLQTIDRRKILSEIEEIQEKNSKVDVPTTSGQQRTDEIWKLSCSKCRREVTSSDQFCKVKQHYVCVDKEFPSKALKGPLMTIIKSSEEHVSGKLQCGEITCRQEWGSQMIYRNHLIYVLGIKHFVLSNGKETKVAKKWKDAPFQVESSYDDLIGSQGSDVEMDEDVDDDIYEFEF